MKEKSQDTLRVEFEAKTDPRVTYQADCKLTREGDVYVLFSFMLTALEDC